MPGRLPERQAAVIGLYRLDAATFVDELKAMISESRNHSPYLSADTFGNSIRVHGTADQIKEVRQLIRALDDAQGLNVKLDHGSATTLAEAIEMLFPLVRDNPIKVVFPGRLGAPPPTPKAPESKKDSKSMGPDTFQPSVRHDVLAERASDEVVLTQNPSLARPTDK